MIIIMGGKSDEISLPGDRFLVEIVWMWFDQDLLGSLEKNKDFSWDIFQELFILAWNP